MKNRYWLMNRDGTYYAKDSQTGKRESLGTRNRAEAQRLIVAKNEVVQNTALNLQLGKVYLAGHDPKLTARTWAEVMDQLASHGKEQSQKRCRQAMDSKPFGQIRHKKIVETTGDDLRAVLQAGRSATNNYLHRLHNLALGLGWLPWPIIPPKLWPKVIPKEKRGVTSDEHEAIMRAEMNAERRKYYQMLWETGAAQSDAAAFSAQNIDWQAQTFTYKRSKTGTVARLSIGPRFSQLLQELPQAGPFFPALAQQSDTDRSAEFARRCRILKIKGISLHSYRYGWAERALANGYPERFAQAALGHKSRAVHQAYAKKGEAIFFKSQLSPSNLHPSGISGQKDLRQSILAGGREPRWLDKIDIESRICPSASPVGTCTLLSNLMQRQLARHAEPHSRNSYMMLLTFPSNPCSAKGWIKI